MQIGQLVGWGSLAYEGFVCQVESWSSACRTSGHQAIRKQCAASHCRSAKIRMIDIMAQSPAWPANHHAACNGAHIRVMACLDTNAI